MGNQGLNIEISSESVEVDLLGRGLQHFNKIRATDLLVSYVRWQRRKQRKTTFNEAKNNVWGASNWAIDIYAQGGLFLDLRKCA